MWYMVCLRKDMHVIQSQLINYSYDDRTQKKIKLVRWWVLAQAADSSDDEEIALPFTSEQQAIFINFMDDHPDNFPKNKREIFTSQSLLPPSLDYEDRDSDIEKPCVLLIRSNPVNKPWQYMQAHGYCFAK